MNQQPYQTSFLLLLPAARASTSLTGNPTQLLHLYALHPCCKICTNYKTVHTIPPLLSLEDFFLLLLLSSRSHSSWDAFRIRLYAQFLQLTLKQAKKHPLHILRCKRCLFPLLMFQYRNILLAITRNLISV